MREKTLTLKLLLVYVVIFGAPACYYPFLAIYFGDRGLSYSQIGIAFAVNSLTAVICQPIWGYITDKYSGKIKAIAVGALGSSVFIFSFMFSHNFMFVLLSIFLFMIFQSPTNSVSDAYCYEIMDKHKNIQYGRIRLGGSFGYAVIALAVGTIIKYSSINSAFVIYSVLTVIGVAILFTIPFKSKIGGSRINLSDIGELIKNKKFVIFIISVCIINISIGSNGSYIAVLIQKTGGDVSKLGLLWFIVAMSEVPVFFIGNRLLKKYEVLNVYVISLLIYALRFVLDAFAPSYSLVIVIQLMQSITFALYILSSMQYLNMIVPSQMRTTGMTIFAAGGGLGGFIGNIFGGVLLEHINIFTLFRIMALVSLIALMVAVYLKLLDNKNLKALSTSI